MKFIRAWKVYAAALLAISVALLSDRIYAKAPSFVVEYEIPQTLQYAELYTSLKNNQILETIANLLNKSTDLPEAITLSFVECGEANAFYLYEQKQVAVCYELLVYLAVLLQDHEEHEKLIDGVFYWVLLHEIGHALVHILDLPITGLEEDAVDQLATIWLLDGSEEGEFAVMAVAIWFAEGFEKKKIKPVYFADQHRLNAQRFFNMICWIYGSDSARNTELLDQGYLTAERAEFCPGEFARMKRAWNLLLQPYIKHEGP